MEPEARANPEARAEPPSRRRRLDADGRYAAGGIHPIQHTEDPASEAQPTVLDRVTLGVLSILPTEVLSTIFGKLNAPTRKSMHQVNSYLRWTLLHAYLQHKGYLGAILTATKVLLPEPPAPAPPAAAPAAAPPAAAPAEGAAAAVDAAEPAGPNAAIEILDDAWDFMDGAELWHPLLPNPHNEQQQEPPQPPVQLTVTADVSEGDRSCQMHCVLDSASQHSYVESKLLKRMQQQPAHASTGDTRRMAYSSSTGRQLRSALSRVLGSGGADQVQVVLRLNLLAASRDHAETVQQRMLQGGLIDFLELIVPRGTPLVIELRCKDGPYSSFGTSFVTQRLVGRQPLVLLPNSGVARA